MHKCWLSTTKYSNCNLLKTFIKYQNIFSDYLLFSYRYTPKNLIVLLIRVYSYFTVNLWLAPLRERQEKSLRERYDKSLPEGHEKSLREGHEKSHRETEVSSRETLVK